MKRVLFILLVLSIFLGCHEGSLKQHLVEIDSIAFQYGDEKALSMLNEIAPESINDEESLAYYWLLKIRTEIRLQKEIRSAAPLDITIAYYKKHHDNGKLARAYGYKAYILEDQGDYKSASIVLKEAEALIKDNKKELAIANMIYLSLARINYEVKEIKLALDYGAKSLKAAYLLNDQLNTVYSLLNMSMCYNALGKVDSAVYYANRCIPLLEDVPRELRPNFYVNLGNVLIKSDIVRAEDYLNKSLAEAPNNFTYKGLARIYYKKGEKAKAVEMWHKALQTDNMYLKSEILQALYDSQQSEGDYESASETAMRIAGIRDSIAQKEKSDNIRGLQEQFEESLSQSAARHRLYMVLMVVGMLLMLSMLAVGYLFYRNTKGRKELRRTQSHLEQYRNELKVLEQEGKSGSKEVERLTQKISELQARQGALLQNGRERYEEVMSGGTTIRWKRNDFADCIEYYRTIDSSFVTHMETSYRHLSSKYMFFALLEHLGKTDEELQRVMAIGQNTVRSIRSRIGSSKIE